MPLWTTFILVIFARTYLVHGQNPPGIYDGVATRIVNPQLSNQNYNPFGPPPINPFYRPLLPKPGYPNVTPNIPIYPLYVPSTPAPPPFTRVSTPSGSPPSPPPQESTTQAVTTTSASSSMFTDGTATTSTQSTLSVSTVPSTTTVVTVPVTQSSTANYTTSTTRQPTTSVQLSTTASSITSSQPSIPSSPTTRRPSTTTIPLSTRPIVTRTESITNPIETSTAASATPKTPTTPHHIHHNGVKGKPHLFCLDNAIIFTSEVWFPFKGRVFARGRAGIPECVKVYTVETKFINVTFPYEKCGVPDGASTGSRKMYSVEIVVQFHETDLNEHTAQSFEARCMSQKIQYETPDLPTRIEDALEELNITPILVEKRADMPQCLMRIVPEDEGEPHSYGPSNKDPVTNVWIGQKLKVEWSLDPPTEAFGFIVRNCTVTDAISGRTFQVVDDKGCSSDINILGHPHYDVYHDLAIVHWHAFKIPDNAMLSFTCSCHVCTDMTDDEGQSSCASIPAPPFCPKVEQKKFEENSIFFDSSNVVANLAEDLNVQTYVEVYGEPDVSYAELKARNRYTKYHAPTRKDIGLKREGKLCLRKGNFLLSCLIVSFLLVSSVGLSVVTCVIRRRRLHQYDASVMTSSVASTTLTNSPCSNYYYNNTALAFGSNSTLKTDSLARGQQSLSKRHSPNLTMDVRLKPR